MSIKNIFDKFFYLEDIEDDQAPAQAQAMPSKQAPKTTPQEAYYQEYRSKATNPSYSKSHEEGTKNATTATQ